jgi:demethoxyubiquinone hydroxylase (CLK1/Coq7/Cat5 family)
VSLQGDQRPEAPARNPNVDRLADCLRSELSAVETYELALKGVTHVGVHHAIQEILESHLRRADLLRTAIVAMGGDPPSSSGIWGAFARAVQAGADLLGDRTAVASLEDGEDRTLALYAGDVSQCDAETTRIIERELLPQQRHTHELCRALKSYVNAPS